MTDLKLTSIQLLGVVVNDLDAAVARYSELFGLDFQIFTSGVDYEVRPLSATAEDPDRPLPRSSRIALDADGTFELIEIPGVDEGYRNIHFRVTDAEAAVDALAERGLKLVRDIQIGEARELVLDSSQLNGIRICLLQYEGDSLAAALAASPRPDQS